MAEHFIFYVGQESDGSPKIRGFLDDAAKNIFIYDDDKAKVLFTIGNASTEITVNAGASIGGHRFVMLSGSSAVHFDPTNILNAGKAIGFSSNSAILGESVTVTTDGIIVNSGWGLIAGTIYYADVDGLITTVTPSSGIQQKVGIAVDSNTMNVRISEPIIKI